MVKNFKRDKRDEQPKLMKLRRLSRNRSTVGELDLFKETYKGKFIDFRDVIFLPFNFLWQIVLAVTIMIEQALVLYEIVFSWSIFDDLTHYSIGNFSITLFNYFSEILFWLDYILLLLHRNWKAHRVTMPYKKEKTFYLIIVLPTIVNITFAPDNDDLLESLNDSTYNVFKYLELLILLRLLRVSSIFSYIMNSIYLNIYACVVIFLCFLGMLCTISACFFYMAFFNRITVPGSIEDQILHLVPMLEQTVFVSWPMKTLGDVALMCFYLVTNSFLLRGQAALQNFRLSMQIIMELYMYVALVFTLIMTSLFVVILLEMKLTALLSAIRMESLCSRLKLMNGDRTIIERIELYYKDANKKVGTVVDQQMKLLLPTSLYRIYTFKIYAPAFKHSHLFRHQDPAFLSAVALQMKTEFHFPGHVLFSKGKIKDVFIYLEKGIVQVMSCFDSSTPILSLFPGSCLGEASIVFQYRSTCRVVCATHCQLLILNRKHFDRLKVDFLVYYKELREEIIERKKKAQLHYSMKLIENSDYYARGHEEFNSLKKIKRLARVSDKLIHRKPASHLSYEDLFFRTEKAEQEIQRFMSSDSNYLDMFVISENTERTRDDITFMRQDFPPILHPHSPFITVWNNILFILIAVYVVYVPLYILEDEADMSSEILCGIIEVVFMCDLFAQCTFAVFTPDRDLVSFKDILCYRLNTPTFLADIVGSIPLNFIQVFLIKDQENIIYGFLQFNHLLRGWRIVQFFNDRIIKLPRYRIVLYTMSSLFYIATFLWYCSVVLIMISCESRTKCDPKSMWVNIAGAHIGESTDSVFLVSTMFFILTRLSFGSSGDIYVPFTFNEHVFVLFINLICLFAVNFFVAFLSILACLLLIAKRDLYDKMCTLVHLSKNYKLESSLHNRILRRLNLLKQVENSGLYLKGDIDFQGIGDALNQDLKLSLWGKLLSDCSIFLDTDKKFQQKIVSKLKQIILQPQEFVCFSGVFCPYMYIIHRGYCELIDTEIGIVKSTKGPGYEFGGLEMLLGIPMLQSVRSMTYCEILYLDKRDFFAILEDFPDYKDQIQATKAHCLPLVDLPIIEGRDTFKNEALPKSKSFHYFGFSLVVGSKEEKEFFDPIYKAGRGAIFLSYFLLRVAILPTGRLIWVMEILRCSFALICCIVFPPRLVLTWAFTRDIDMLYNVLDLFAYIDIYFRFHVAFFNKDGILVTHPLYTFINYAKTSFPLDVFACFPFEKLLGHLVDKNFVNMLQFNRLLQIHRLFSLLDFITNRTIDINLKPKSMKYFLTLLIIINFLASCYVSVHCQDINNNILVIRRDYTVKGLQCDGVVWEWKTLGFLVTPVIFYLNASFFITTLMTQVNFIHFCEKCDMTGWFTILVCYLGMASMLYITCRLSALAYLQNENHRYKQEVNTAMLFLSNVGTPEDLQNDFLLHFMSNWQQHRGEIPEELFRATLNDLLQGDIMFQMYGPCMKFNSVFTSSSNSFIRSVVFESKIKIFNKGTQVLIEGFVHGDVYVLVDGIVCVSTMKRRTSYLEKGAFFGNLHDCEHSQQPVSITAVTIVETLVIKSTGFYQILKTYPVEKAVFEAHRNKYYQVGMKFVPGKVLGTESIIDEIEVLERADIKNKKHLLKGKRFESVSLLLSLTSNFASLYSFATFDVSPFMLCCLYTLDLIHIMLMFVYCRRPFEISRDVFISDSIAIKENYLRQPIGFTLDLLTVFPFETIGLLFPNNMYVYLFLRLNRPFNLFKSLNLMDSFYTSITSVQMKLRVCFLLMKLLVVLNTISLVYTFNHISASGITYNTSFEKYNLFNSARMLVIASFSKFPISLLALHKDYNSFIFVIRYIHLCMNPILLALVIGSAVFYIRTYFFSVIQFVNQQRAILTRMNYHKSAKNFSGCIKEYLRFLWDNHYGCQVPELLKRTPLPLQQKLCWLLYNHHLNEHVIFSKCSPQFLQQLVVHMTSQFFFSGNVVVESGIVDSTMYFLHKGEIDVFVKRDLQWIWVKRLMTEACFGIKQGLAHGIAHQYRFVAYTSVTLLKLDFDSWSYLLPYYKAVERYIASYLQNDDITYEE